VRPRILVIVLTLGTLAVAPSADASHSCSASLALSASNPTPCALAFKVSAKVLTAAHANGEFPSTATVHYRGRSYRFRRSSCSVSSDATHGRARYDSGRFSVTQAWRLPHDEGLFDDPVSSCA
jgi:hypothetical protein